MELARYWRVQNFRYGNGDGGLDGIECDDCGVGFLTEATYRNHKRECIPTPLILNSLIEECDELLSDVDAMNSGD